MDSTKRELFKSAAIIGVGILASGYSPLAWSNEEKEKEVSPVEDLMREHGGLNRILLIYDDIGSRLDQKKDFDPEQLKKSANIIKNFIEGYHEKLEEEYLFPRLLKAGKLTDLISVLKAQHTAGRMVTASILALSNGASLKIEGDRVKLRTALHSFVRMYRPHEAREDTILFPEFKKVVSQKEYDKLGDQFEDREHELFGKEGFEGIVVQIGEIEKAVGLYDLSQFTPKI